MAKNNYQVCRDHNGRTCLKVAEAAGMVHYIPMADLGFEVAQTSVASFNQRYKLLPKYPLDKACQLYLSYAVLLGATVEVLDYLSKEITVTKEDREMATSKFRNPPPDNVKEKPEPKKRVVKSAAKKPDSTTKPKAKAAVKKVKAAAKKPASKKSSGVGEYKSAAQMFQGLIMAGKLTDDQIFEAVKAQFGLDDKKRSYVKWYRNNLIKKGENPPEAK